jgi:hypothetical protein
MGNILMRLKYGPAIDATQPFKQENFSTSDAVWSVWKNKDKEEDKDNLNF